MLKLSSVGLCCSMFGAVLIGTSVAAEAKKGSFVRAVGIGVGVGIAKQVVKRDKRSDGDDGTTASTIASPAAGMMIATPVTNTAPVRAQPPAVKPSEPMSEGKVVCVAGCY